MEHARPGETVRSVRPEPLGKSERFLMAARLRQDAKDILTVADRIDPEHATWALIQDPTMGQLADNWDKVKKGLADRDAKLAAQAATLDAAQAAMRDTVGRLDAAQAATRDAVGKLDAANRQVAALDAALVVLRDEVAARRALDAADEAALADMATLLGAAAADDDEESIVVAAVTLQ